MHFSMEDMMMGKQTFNISNNPSNITPCNFNPLGIRKDSRMVTKVKPKIRIIHIFAPEIIKTDVANFRELVQRLTGKPDSSSPAGPPSTGPNKRKKSRKMPRLISHQEEVITIRKNTDHQHQQQQQQQNLMNNGNEDLYFTFPEMDGFIHDISELPVDAYHHHLLPFDQSTR